MDPVLKGPIVMDLNIQKSMAICPPLVPFQSDFLCIIYPRFVSEHGQMPIIWEYMLHHQVVRGSWSTRPVPKYPGSLRQGPTYPGPKHGEVRVIPSAYPITDTMGSYKNVLSFLRSFPRGFSCSPCFAVVLWERCGAVRDPARSERGVRRPERVGRGDRCSGGSSRQRAPHSPRTGAAPSCSELLRASIHILGQVAGRGRVWGQESGGGGGREYQGWGAGRV